jgi:ribonuclease E
LNYNNDSQANGGSDTAAQGEERQDSANGTPERRERRSRDRYGRDRRERNNDGNTSESLQTDQASQEVSAQEEAPVARSYFDRAASTAAPAESTSKAEPPVASPAPVAAPTPTAVPSAGLPKVQAYELPMASLVQVAEGSGLQWVNSDPEKIAQVQAAIAAEPKAVHVPRVRPPAVVVDEGPLVLVETRKDLSDMKLPF